jgi:AcrR family transcriptional regulator
MQDEPAGGEITAEDIVSAAHAIAHADGYDALTVRALGARLDLGSAAIYRHIVSKQHLQIAIADLVLSEIDVAVVRRHRNEPRWIGELRGLSSEVRRVLEEHPHVHPVLASELIVTPASLRIAERAVGVLRSGGYRRDALLHVYNGWTGYVFGATILEIKAAGATDERIDSGTSSYLDRLDPACHPNLTEEARWLRERAFSFRSHAGALADGASFERTLDLLLASFASSAPDV